MDELRDIDKKRFPLKTINDVVNLFKDQVNNDTEPNLTLLSIVLGIVEHSLTIKKPLDKRLKGRPNNQTVLTNLSSGLQNDDNTNNGEEIPVINLSDVDVLFELFVNLIKANVDLSLFEHSKYTSTGLLKKVSDVLWTTLTRTFYKDKGHLQFLNTLFSEQKMDCFGMAFGVIAGCQILGLKDVHMAITEDHVWAVHGRNGCLTSEITWHGKGTEDQRGNPVSMTAPENSWLYGWPMVCNRYEEVAILAVAINTITHATLESYQLAALQKRILWMMYDLGHLKKYPIALSTLADLEEIQPTDYEDDAINSTTFIGTNGEIVSNEKNINDTTQNMTTNNNSLKLNKQKRPSSIQLFKQAIEISKALYNDSKIYPHTYLGNYHYRRRHYKEAIRSWANAAQVASIYNYNREDDEMYKEFHDIANDIMPNIVRTCCVFLESQNAGILNATPNVATQQKGQLKKGKKRGNKKTKNDPSVNDNENILASNINASINTTSSIDTNTTVNSTTLSCNANGELVNQTVNSNNNLSCLENSTLNKTTERSILSVENTTLSTNETNAIQLQTQKSTTTSKKSSSLLLLSDSDCYADVLRFFDGICKWEEGSTMPVLHIIWANNMAYVVSKFLPIARTNLKIFLNIEDLENDAKIDENGVADKEKKDNEKSELEKLDATDEKKKPKKMTKLLLRSQKMSSMKDLLTCEKLNTSAIKLLLTAQSQVNSKSSSISSSTNANNNRHVNSDSKQPARKRTRFAE